MDSRVRDLINAGDELVLELGQLLRTMRDTNAWRPLGFGSFDLYRAERFGRRRRWAQQRIQAADTIDRFPELADPDLEIQVIHPDESNAQVEIRRSIAGDYDDNRRVDTNDYYLWKLFYGSSVSDGAGFFYFADGNYDGKVDAGDYVVWRNNLGKELPPLAGEATGSGGVAVGSIVPEPAGAVLAAAACGAALLARRRRRALAPDRGV